jgi:hypothetical protein
MSRHTFHEILGDGVQAVFGGLDLRTQVVIAQFFTERMGAELVPTADPIVNITQTKGSPFIYVEFCVVGKSRTEIAVFPRRQAGTVSVLAKRLDGRYVFLEEKRPRAGRVLSLPGGCFKRDMRRIRATDPEVVENGLRELLEEARCTRTSRSRCDIVEFPQDADVVVGSHFLLMIDRVRFLGVEDRVLEDGVEKVVFANRAEVQRFLGNGTRFRNASVAGLIIGMSTRNTPSQPVRAIVDTSEFTFDEEIKAAALKLHKDNQESAS